jgi:predicted nucleic acid-binding Zn ribbon protein
VYCSDLCKVRNQRQRRGQQHGTPKRVCVVCHTPMPRELNLMVTYCSEACLAIKRRTASMKRKGWKISPREVYLLLQQHPQECTICGGTDNVVIDHCHAAIRFRGFLCSNCNTGIGMFGDDIERLKRAIAYLEASSGALDQQGQEADQVI